MTRCTAQACTGRLCPAGAGTLGESIPLYKKAIAIWEVTGSPLLATGLYNLANTYMSQVSVQHLAVEPAPHRTSSVR